MSVTINKINEKITGIKNGESLGFLSQDYEFFNGFVHPFMNMVGALPIPFKRSLDEYIDWNDLYQDCSKYDLVLWLESIKYAAGYRAHKIRTVTTAVVPGFATFELDRTGDTSGPEYFILDTKMHTENKIIFESGVEFWFEYLDLLAVQLGVDVDNLRYHMASANAINTVEYRGFEND